MRVLVVDDDGDVRARLRACASLLYEVPDSDHALAILRAVPADVIVLRSRKGGAVDWVPLLLAACQAAVVAVVPDAFNEDEGRAVIAAGAKLYIERWPIDLPGLLTAAASSSASQELLATG